jgi:hypothetical protein
MFPDEIKLAVFNENLPRMPEKAAMSEPFSDCASKVRLNLFASFAVETITKPLSGQLV